ncbi:histidinol-phosphate transaminase [Tissierella sp. MSJ-40]|uniref:Histidinol-phosphate aminotransferase n=1 Tax=Tissierella simiarum TaxID=2841534 RepID=A0ABS6E6Z5_9FIRM|nr:histidinol-phosphate transaminase [Tissierella simiarum]MBU5438693.1 histidinol-phosphate transaminase [Tissierella simiarum]
MLINHREEIKSLQPYKPGKPIEDVKREYGLDNVIKLASNENPLGCSEKVKEKIKEGLNNLAIYPDGNATKLKEALSKSLNVSVEEILPSSGSDEMIDLIVKAYVNKGDEIIMADITFPRYIQTAEMMGGIPVIVPLKDYTFDLNGMLEKITDKTKIIWICNPNNPTGTMVKEEELVKFFDKVPENVLIIYDEAYREYATKDDYPKDSIKFIKNYPNILVMRTFSKAYGLAGIRVAYSVGNKEIIENINKVRGPFNVNSLALEAAITALEDQDFIKKSYDLNLEGKNYLYEEFDKMGFFYPPSETNHIFVNVERNGQEVFVELQKRGVIIRPMGGTFIRVSIGTMEENKIFIEKLKEVLGK